MTTPIDRESVERWECSACPRTMDPEMVADPLGDWVRYEDFRAALDAAEAEIARMREALSNIAVVGFSDDLAVSAAIANQAVTQARAALQENPDGNL